MGSTEPPELETADDRDGGVATAWGLLSSPRVFLGLTVVLGLLFAWAQTVPQRPGPGELAPLAPFAEAEALGALGLDDVSVAWPVLLVGMLLVLVAAALLMQRARGGASGSFITAHKAVSPQSIDALRTLLPHALGKQRLVIRAERHSVSARTGLGVEASTVLIVGLVAIVAASFIGRTNAFEGRISLAPGRMTEASTVAVRDGDIFLPRALPIDLRCARPDPMDPSRSARCTLVTSPGAAPETLILTPGTTTRSDSGLSLTVSQELPRAYARDEALELLVRRNPSAAPERLQLAPGAPIELAATHDRLEMFAGADGPLVLVTHAGQPPELLAPPNSASVVAPAGLSLEVVPPTTQVIEAHTSPERLLTIVGLLFVALGLLGLALMPSTSVMLTRTVGGTRVHIHGAQPTRVRQAAQRLGLDVIEVQR